MGENIIDAKKRFEEVFLNPKWRSIKTSEASRLMARAMTENVTNIVGTGIGEKLTGGRRTGQPAIRVYVIQKVPKEMEGVLPGDMLVPSDLVMVNSQQM